MADPKEPNFFCTDMEQNVHIKKFRDYQNLFKNASNKHKAVGEASVHYLRSKVAIPKLLKVYPDSRFIVMLRNPLTFLPSWHNQLLFSCLETEKDISTAWKLQESRLVGQSLPTNCKNPYILNYREAINFGSQVKRLLSYVPKEKILFLKFEKFAKDTRNSYLEVLNFLNIEDDNKKDFKIVNRAHEHRSKVLSHSLLAVYKILDKIPISKNNSFRKFFKRKFILIRDLNRKSAVKQTIPIKLKIKIFEEIEKDIDLLEVLTDLDLADWKILES